MGSYITPNPISLSIQNDFHSLFSTFNFVTQDANILFLFRLNNNFSNLLITLYLNTYGAISEKKGFDYVLKAIGTESKVERQKLF